MELLGQIVFSVPFGVVFVYDYHNRRPSPDWDSPTQVVAGSAEAIRIRVLHGQVGMADICVGFGEPSSGTIKVFDGEFDLEFGQLLVSDANDQNALVVGVEPGNRALRIFVDSVPWPKRIELIVDET
jgi:hypothetical protein